MEKVFAASWGRLTLVLTLIFGGLAGIIALAFLALGLWLFSHHNPAAAVVMFLAALLVALILSIPFCLSPKSYAIGHSVIAVRRRCGDVAIPLKNLAEVSTANGKDMFAGALRRNASGGLFGFFGGFSSPDMGGDFTSYAARIEGPLIVLRLKHGDPVVLSPDRPQEFLETVLNASAAEERR